jgi:hypothetical protein
MFNGDRLAIVKEFRIKKPIKNPVAIAARDPNTIDFIEGKSDAELLSSQIFGN